MAIDPTDPTTQPGHQPAALATTVPLSAVTPKPHGDHPPHNNAAPSKSHPQPAPAPSLPFLPPTTPSPLATLPDAQAPIEACIAEGVEAGWQHKLSDLPPPPPHKIAGIPLFNITVEVSQ